MTTDQPTSPDYTSMTGIERYRARKDTVRAKLARHVANRHLTDVNGYRPGDPGYTKPTPTTDHTTTED